MKELVRTIISIGLVDDNQVQEFQRWGLIDRVLILDNVQDSVPDVVARLNLALDVVGIERKEMDLSILEEYKSSASKGMIYVYLNGVYVKEPVEVMYGMNRWGEYILPWGASGQEDILTNGKTYLETENSRVYMVSTRPVYFDDLQSFVVCKPGIEEARDGQRQ